MLMLSICSNYRMFGVYHGHENLIGLRLYKAVRCCLPVSRIMASCSCFQLSCFVASTFAFLELSSSSPSFSCFISHPTDMESLDSQKLSCKSRGCCSDSFGKCQMLFLRQDSSFGPSADLISCRYKVIFLQ